MGKPRHKVPDAELKLSKRAQAIQQLMEAGFDPSQFSEFQLASIMMLVLLRVEVVEAIDAMGAMLEESLMGEEE